MKVTCRAKDIQLQTGYNSQKMATASITLDDAFTVTGLSVVSGKNGLFVSMPKQKGLDNDGNIAWYDTSFPRSKELRAEINNVVLDAYQEKLNELSRNAQNRSSEQETAPDRGDEYGEAPDMC